MTRMVRETEDKIDVMQAYIAGCVIEFQNKGAIKTAWTPCSTPTWDWAAYHYRIKPATPDVIDWTHIADRFKFCARDENGAVYFYEEEPTTDMKDGIWRYVKVTKLDLYYKGVHTRGVHTRGDVAWYDSLIIRPEGE